MSTTEFEMAILDDTIQDAKDYYEEMNLNSSISFKYLSGINDVITTLEDSTKRRAYLIDINLGEGRSKEGIKAIKKIKAKEADAIIMVYTGYPQSEEECRAAGATYFFTKPHDYPDNMKLFSRTVELEFIKSSNLLTPNWKKITKLPAKFVRYDDDYFYLNCMIDQQNQLIVEKKFPINCWEKTTKFYLDMPIMIYLIFASSVYLACSRVL